MAWRFLLRAEVKRAAWLHALNDLAINAAVDGDLAPAGMQGTIEKLSRYFDDEQPVIDSVLLAVAAVAGVDRAGARQLAYAAAAASAPNSPMDRQLTAQWHLLARDTLGTPSLFKAFWDAACRAPRGSALKAGSLMEWSRLSADYLQNTDVDPARLADIFAEYATEAAASGPGAKNAERAAAVSLGLALRQMTPVSALEKARKISSDCAGALISEHLRGDFLPLHSDEVLRVAEKILRP